MKNNKLLYTIFICGFVVLYLATALISLVHAIGFFKIGNVSWMAITLAAVFEVGQMVVLSSLLLSDNKKTLIPWILLTILTLVQVIGNVFSTYKYIIISNSNDFIYLQKPLIDWWLQGVSQESIIVIISWIIGALLPIIALFMTSMVANNIKLRNNDGNDNNEEVKVQKQEEQVKKVNVVIEPKQETKKDTITPNTNNNINANKKKNNVIQTFKNKVFNNIKKNKQNKDNDDKNNRFIIDSIVNGYNNYDNTDKFRL